MTDDRLKTIRELADIAVTEKRDMHISQRTVLEMLDMIDRLRAEAESRNEYTVGDLV